MPRPTSFALLVGLLVLAAAGLVVTVTGNLRDTNQVHISTLYRDSPGLSAIDLPNVRVHVATFDTDETSGYNHRECDRISRLLNANAEAQKVSTKYWCEPGRYTESGLIPSDVESDFPAWPR